MVLVDLKFFKVKENKRTGKDDRFLQLLFGHLIFELV